jgi:uncharacterized membrane protein YfcA
MPQTIPRPAVMTDNQDRSGCEETSRGRTLRTWCLDVALAYLVGLMIGAPAGLFASWATQRELALTVVIVLAMIAVLAVRRAQRRRAN